MVYREVIMQGGDLWPRVTYFSQNSKRHADKRLDYDDKRVRTLPTNLKLNVS